MRKKGHVASKEIRTPRGYQLEAHLVVLFDLYFLHLDCLRIPSRTGIKAFHIFIDVLSAVIYFLILSLGFKGQQGSGALCV